MTEVDYEDRQLLRKRVHLGAEWLDERQPDWWQRVNLDTLRLSSAYSCVLGQLSKALIRSEFKPYAEYGMLVEFDDGCSWAPDLAHLALTDGEAVDRGFCQPRETPAMSEHLGWAVLNDAWREQILARRTAAGTNG